MNIFERASRNKLRFRSMAGELTVEQLWDLPLSTTRAQVSLDQLAQSVNQRLTSATTESFVNPKPNPEAKLYQLQLDILKHIIDSKLKDAEAATTRAAKSSQRAKLQSILDAKDDEDLKGMTREQIQAKLDAT